MRERDAFAQSFKQTQARIDTTRSKMKREQRRVRKMIVVGLIAGGTFGLCAVGSLAYGAIRVLTNLGLW